MPEDGTSAPLPAPPGDESTPAGDLGITVSLDQFNGPMDLLLYLVRRTEVDIKDLPITTIADQFAAWVEAAAGTTLDLEAAGDFVVMAATLLEIKARQVAPPPEGTEVEYDGEDEFDPRAGLIRKLLVYRAAKEAAFDLDRRDDLRRRLHERGHREIVPDDPAEVDAWELKDVGSGTLANLWFDLLKRIDSLGPRTVIVDDVPMGVRIAQVVESMRQRGEGRLSELFQLDNGVIARVGMVMALLEGTRQRMLNIVQAEQYGDVRIRFRPEEDRAIAVGDPGPAEVLPKRHRRPPLVTWAPRDGTAAEIEEDQAGESGEPPVENEEQRFLRDLETSIGVERLLGRSADLERGFISWWEETHPGEPLPPGVVKPEPPPPPPAPVAEAKPDEPAKPKRAPPRPRQAVADKPTEPAKPADGVVAEPIPDPIAALLPTVMDPVATPMGPSFIVVPLPTAVADPVPGAPSTWPLPEPGEPPRPVPVELAAPAQEPAAVAPEPEPVAVAPEPEPVAVAPDPEPVAVAPDPEPVAVAPDPEPIAVAPDPEPVAVAPEPDPEPVAPEPAPVAVAPDPEPVAAAPEPEPEPEPDVVVIAPASTPLLAVPEPVAPEPVVDTPAVVAAAVVPEPVAVIAAPLAVVPEPAPIPVSAAVVVAEPPPDPEPDPLPPPSPPPPRPAMANTPPTPAPTTIRPTPMSRPRHLPTAALLALLVLAVGVCVAWMDQPRDVLTIAGPHDGAVVSRQQPVAWTLNLPLDETALDQAPVPVVTPAGSGTCAWRDARTCVFTPSGELPADATVSVAFTADLRARGGFRFERDLLPTMTVRTLPAVTVSAPVAQLPAFGPGVIELALNRIPADPTALLADVAIVPEIPLRAAISDGRLRLTGDFRPGTSYRLVVASNPQVAADNRPVAWTGEVVMPARAPGVRLAPGIARQARLEAVGVTQAIVEDAAGRRQLIRFAPSADAVASAALPAWLLLPGENRLHVRWADGSTDIVVQRCDLPADPDDAIPVLLGGTLPVTAAR